VIDGPNLEGALSGSPSRSTGRPAMLHARNELSPLDPFLTLGNRSREIGQPVLNNDKARHLAGGLTLQQEKPTVWRG
jgi:hypothetical protein